MIQSFLFIGIRSIRYVRFNIISDQKQLIISRAPRLNPRGVIEIKARSARQNRWNRREKWSSMRISILQTPAPRRLYPQNSRRNRFWCWRICCRWELVYVFWSWVDEKIGRKNQVWMDYLTGSKLIKMLMYKTMEMNTTEPNLNHI